MITFKDKVKIFLKKRWVFWSIVLSLSLNFYIWYLIYNFIDFEKFLHVLHFNVYFGVDLLDSPIKLLSVPFIGIFLILVNLIIAFFVYNPKKDSVLLSYIILSLSVFVNFELVMYMIGIIGMEY